MTMKFLSTLILVLALFSAKGQSDTTIMRVNNYPVGVVIGNTYYPSDKASKLTTSTIIDAKRYELFEGVIPDAINEKMFPKTDKDRGYYLKRAGALKNLAMVVQGGGALYSAARLSEGSLEEATLVSLSSSLVSLCLNVAGNYALIKAGEVE